MHQEAMEAEIRTPLGKMELSSITRRIAAGVTDLFMFVALVGILTIIIQTIGSSILGFWSEYTGLGSLVVVTLGFIISRKYSSFRSPGEWALGLRRFSMSELDEYSGKGSIWCVENLMRKEYTRRTFIILGWFCAFYLILFSYGYYINA